MAERRRQLLLRNIVVTVVGREQKIKLFSEGELCCIRLYIADEKPLFPRKAHRLREHGRGQVRSRHRIARPGERARERAAAATHFQSLVPCTQGGKP